MQKTLFIRVDASRQIGYGHLIRCLTIAEYLRQTGIRSIFISRFEFVQAFVARKGFASIMLGTECSVANELDAIRGFECQSGNKAVMLDINNYHTFDASNSYCDYLREIKKLSSYLISFEDFKIHPPISDLVVIPYVAAHKIDLPKKAGCKYLIGARFYVLNEEFLRVPKVIIKEDVKNILVTMGGCDSEGITMKVLKAIDQLNIDITLKVIVGGLSRLEDSAISSAMGNFKGQYSILRDVKNMAQLMSESHLAIISSGLTRYEIASVGLPGIIISNNEYHFQLMNEFVEYGSAIHLGEARELSSSVIAESIKSIISNYEKRCKMSQAGMTLVDGKGIQRILEEIPKGILHE